MSKWEKYIELWLALCEKGNKEGSGKLKFA
jgi:hypothetical protein